MKGESSGEIRFRGEGSAAGSIFIPYAVILVGSLLVGWFAYGKTAELIESETVRTTSAALQQIQEALDQRFAEIENLARQMSSESKVLSFQFEKEPFAGTGPYRLWDLERVCLITNCSITSLWIITSLTETAT